MLRTKNLVIVSLQNCSMPCFETRCCLVLIVKEMCLSGEQEKSLNRLNYKLLKNMILHMVSK